MWNGPRAPWRSPQIAVCSFHLGLAAAPNFAPQTTGARLPYAHGIVAGGTTMLMPLPRTTVLDPGSGWGELPARAAKDDSAIATPVRPTPRASTPLSARREERREQRGALLGEEAGGDLGAVVEAGLGEDVEDRA